MSDKTKWLSVYSAVAFVPLFVFWLQLGPQATSYPGIHNFLIFAPYVGLALIGILGWQINQTRIFWAALFLLFFYHSLLHPSSGSIRGPVIQSIGAGFPLSLCVIFLLKENRLWSDKSLARLLLALTPFLLLACLLYWAPDIYQKIFFWSQDPPGVKNYRIPPLCWASAGLFLLVVFFQPDQKIKPFLNSLLTSLIPFLFAIQTGLAAASPWETPRWTVTVFYTIISFTAITLILLHSILHMYWKKVYQDILTGVPNRQALDERLHTLSGEYALAMVDIDHFKKFNDTYGHAEGDNVLRMVAQHLEEHLGFRVYRYGGEEFCVVFEGNQAPGAFEMMDKTRGSLEKRKFRLRNQKRRKERAVDFFTKKPIPLGKGVHITISVGVAAASKNSGDFESVIKKADQALYKAKDGGRNKVVADK